MNRYANSLIARGYSREYAENVEADRLDRAREDEKDRQLEASARLRDAAPELLAALLDALPHLEAHDKRIEQYGKTILGTLNKARAAIAKAINQ